MTFSCIRKYFNMQSSFVWILMCIGAVMMQLSFQVAILGKCLLYNVTFRCAAGSTAKGTAGNIVIWNTR